MVEGSWELLPYLSEASLGTKNETKTIRVGWVAFDMKEFFKINQESSTEAARVRSILTGPRKVL
jgi:hypothetical protein